MENIIAGIRQSIHTKTRLKQVIINKGGAITDTTLFEEYPDILEAIETGSSGEAIEIATSEEMDALLVEENVGKIYKFVGVTDETYTNGQYYIIEEV